MILGIGTDIVSMARIQRAMENPRFIERILTEAERALACDPAFVAGRWAAKEALAKAIGRVSSWHDIEILRTETGAPKLTKCPGLGEERYWLTISHEQAFAVAFAVRERAVS